MPSHRLQTKKGNESFCQQDFSDPDKTISVERGAKDIIEALTSAVNIVGIMDYVLSCLAQSICALADIQTTFGDWKRLKCWVALSSENRKFEKENVLVCR